MTNVQMAIWRAAAALAAAKLELDALQRDIAASRLQGELAALQKRAEREAERCRVRKL